MTCTPFDLRDYYFEGLDAMERRQVEEHLATCVSCAAELESLRLTSLALKSLPEEEVPRRIAFVSDKVFEPSAVVRFWRTFWASGLRMASAAAIVLAGAIVFHAFRQPPPVQTVRIVQPPVIDTRLEIQDAVSKAVTESEARNDAKLRAFAEENAREKEQLRVRFQEMLDYQERRNRVMTVASNRLLENGQ